MDTRLIQRQIRFNAQMIAGCEDVIKNAKDTLKLYKSLVYVDYNQLYKKRLNKELQSYKRLLVQLVELQKAAKKDLKKRCAATRITKAVYE